LRARETGEEFTVLTRLHSVPTATCRFPSLPAGMIDWEGNFVGNMAREIREETGLEIHESKLVDLTELAYNGRFQGVYPSIGGTDEFIRIFVFKEEMDEARIRALHERHTGLAEEHEKITLQVVPLGSLWRETSDAKALAALTLFNQLKAEGRLPLSILPR